ncbi:MAG: cereblon family protein [Methylococcaceae bacterium]|nr:cereblon family protein [Methylococcaceae bacterium]
MPANFGYRFDTRNDEQREHQILAALSELEESREALKCAACGTIITYREAGIRMGGQHARWFTNPSGYSFHIGCFDTAPGCRRFGAETEEHSWFPGYAWTIALCSGCGLHLGWRFRSQADQFHGLILDRLVATAD